MAERPACPRYPAVTRSLFIAAFDPETERVLGVGIVWGADRRRDARHRAGRARIRPEADDPPASALSETVMEAADVFLGESAHVYNPKGPGDWGDTFWFRCHRRREGVD